LAVIAEYIFAAPCLDVVPKGVLKIIDTHDVFSRKQAQVLAYGIEDPLPCSVREERNYLLKSDLVIAIQLNEARLLSGLAGNRDVITIGVDFDVVAEVDDSQMVRGRILVVGSDNPLNQHGLHEFYRHAWPIIRSRHPDAMLRVVGKVADRLRTDDDRVCCIGWVPNLEDEYKRAEVVINPTIAGTGLKVKSVEALCHAKALVCTPNSVEGIESELDPPYVVCSEWSSFADAVLRLLGSDNERQKLQQRARTFAGNNFSTESTYAPLARKLRAHIGAVEPIASLAN
jgi:glycosyltransferase involved in cell wall biosynthesis